MLSDVNWFGDWTNRALYKVGKIFTSKTDLEISSVRIRFLLKVVDFETKRLFALGRKGVGLESV